MGAVNPGVVLGLTNLKRQQPSVLFGRKEREMNLVDLLKDLYKEDSGQDLIEYALIAALIAVACVAAVQSLATKMSTEFATISANLQ